MKKTLYIAAAMVAAQIGTTTAAVPVENIRGEPTRFSDSEAAEMCPKLLGFYEQAIAVGNAGLPQVMITKAAMQATEARSLAQAGGCELKPFVRAFLKQSK